MEMLRIEFTQSDSKVHGLCNYYQGLAKIYTHTRHALWPHLLLVWQQLVSSGEVLHVSPDHLPDLARFMEIWDRSSDGPIVEWHAYSFPSPFPRQINLLGLFHRRRKNASGLSWVTLFSASVSQCWIDKFQFHENQISYLSVQLLHLIWLKCSWKCIIFQMHQKNLKHPDCIMQCHLHNNIHP